MIEVYAIADHPGPPLPDVNGVRAVPAGRIAALCADVEETALSPAALWAHEAVVEALMEDRDLLPVRYGTRLADEAQVLRAVAELERDYGTLGARCELTGPWPPYNFVPGGTGTAP